MFEFVTRLFKPQFTWKYMDLDASLVDEIRQAYLSNLPDYSNGTYFVQILDIKLPLIKGKQVASACLIYTPGNNDIRMAHKDPFELLNGSSTYALNIPFINCENSRTTLYKDRKPFFISSKQGAAYAQPKNEAMVEIQAIYKIKPFTSYVLDRPILFDTQIFHAVHNFSPEPRLAISLRFTEQPVEWL